MTIIEQDHRFIKKLTRPMQTFKSLNSASATLAGIEVAHIGETFASVPAEAIDQLLSGGVSYTVEDETVVFSVED